MKSIKVNLLVLILVFLCSCNVIMADPNKDRGQADSTETTEEETPAEDSGSKEEEIIVEAMTPYSTLLSTDKFLCGATFDLDNTYTTARITEELEKMKRSFNINCVTVYGLENLNYNLRVRLFEELKRLEMKIVVRIESYSQSTFAFKESDAESVVDSYESLLSFVSAAERKEQVAYFAVNMPVDDEYVQRNAGGLNTKAWKDAQVKYAVKVIKLLRERLAKEGFSDAKLYLSVHYGWDNSFDIPSYAEAGADGYFINNYSYPKNGIPTASDSDDDLINAERLSISMKKYTRQYGNAPVVMEFGFHTVEYNGGTTPAQTAGLVKDKDAKVRALKASYNYYTEEWPCVNGILYFGYNLLKEEGGDNAVMDWCLSYPSEGNVRALDGVLSDDVAVNGGLITLTESGSNVVYEKCKQLQSIAVEYTSSGGAEIILKTNGRKRAEAVLPSSTEFTMYGIPVVVAEGFDLSIELVSGDITIKSVNLLENLEGEYAVGDKVVGKDDKASNGLYASSISEGVTFKGVRGGEKVTLSYSAEKETTVTFFLGDKRAKLTLPKTSSFKTVTVSMPIYRGADLRVAANNDDFKLDYISLTGTPQ